MAYEMKEGTGSLWKNDRREKDTQAHARGSALIDGVEWWVDAWTNATTAGERYQSLKFRRKDAQVQPQPAQGIGNDDPDDFIPF